MVGEARVFTACFSLEIQTMTWDTSACPRMERSWLSSHQHSNHWSMCSRLTFSWKNVYGPNGPHSSQSAANSQFSLLQSFVPVLSAAPRRELVCAHSPLDGQLNRAMELLSGMDEQHIVPSVELYRSLLKECTRRKALAQAKLVHTHLVKHGLEATDHLGESVVKTLVKCGSLNDAVKVFQRLPSRSVVSWTALIFGYADSGQAEEALRAYQGMREEGVHPNAYTFVGLVKACGRLGDLEEGKRIHAEVVKHRCESAVFVGNSLVDMYGKCGSIADARSTFDSLLHRDVVSWNAMLTAYVQHGQAEDALLLYEEMQSEFVDADARTFVSILQACCMVAEMEQVVMANGCCKARALGKGKAIHAELWRRGQGCDSFVSNTLVSFYTRCCSIEDAETTFHGLAQHDLVAWTAMIGAYVELGQAEKAFQLYMLMWEEGVEPDNRTFVGALKACAMLAEAEECVVVNGLPTRMTSAVGLGKLVHAEAWRKGFESDIFVGSTLISMYGKFGSSTDAKYVFDRLLQPDVVAWTALHAAYVEQGQTELAWKLYYRMRVEGVSINEHTAVSLLQACIASAEEEETTTLDGHDVKARSLEMGKAIHADCEMMKGYQVANPFVSSALISMYGKCGSFTDAHMTFGGLTLRNVATCNTMLAVYVEHGLGEKALQLFREMQDEGVGWDSMSLVSALQACVRTGSLDTVKQIHGMLDAAGDIVAPRLANMLITAYGRCSSLADGEAVFDALHEPDVVSWNALMASYARQGDYAASLRCYDRMLESGVCPDGVTFLSLLSACGHAGLLDRGIDYFESMSKIHGVTPGCEHYVSMVDLLARAGCFTRVQDLLSTMPMQPDLAMWLCLLGACQKHGQVELGERAFENAVRLDPKQAAAYAMMSNIYLDCGLSERATEVMRLKQRGDVCKQPGQSWIEHEQEVHTFMVGDRKHEQVLYYMLSEASSRLRDDKLTIWCGRLELEEGGLEFSVKARSPPPGVKKNKL